MNWLVDERHLDWLFAKTSALMEFALPSIRPEGGFYYLDENGKDSGVAPRLFLGARAVHAGAIGVALGIPGSGRILEHAVASLAGYFWDEENGGWIEPGADRKMAYEHVHVGLGLSSAIAVGFDEAAPLLERAIELIDSKWWEPEAGALVESYARDWSDLEDYRGANANMHGVEALLAIGDVTGNPIHHERALQIADRIINVEARNHGWLIPEHYSSDWVVDTEYNRDQPDHPFRPFGATLGHSLEWARFLINLNNSELLPEVPWLVPAAEALAKRALVDAWGVDGHEGLVYTIDWDGNPISTARLHWPVCEAIQAVAVLSKQTNDPLWSKWYQKVWDHAALHFVEPRGTWINEVDTNFVENPGIWPGRPDLYHSLGAYQVPTVGLAPFVTLALAVSH